MPFEIQTVVVTPEFISAMAGLVLSLIFSYVPKLNVWYAARSPEAKRGLMALLLLLVTVVIFLLGCALIIPVADFTCTQGTAVRFTWVFITAMVANQSTYQLTPDSKAVKRVKLLRASQA